MGDEAEESLTITLEQATALKPREPLTEISTDNINLAQREYETMAYARILTEGVFHDGD